MRIAIVGTANQGKTTFVSDMIAEWPSYKRSKESYRSLLKEQRLPVNKNGTKQSQGQILDCLISDIKETKRGDFVLFDRCPLDNLVYSLWAYEKKISDIDESFIRESIEKVKESMRNIDIIFFIPITKAAPVVVEQRDDRETDPIFISEIDNIFKMVNYQHQKGKCPFFVADDAPPIIEIFGNRKERIAMARLYLNADGDALDTASSILTPENLDMMEALMREQGIALEDENKLKSDKNKIIGAKLGDKLTPKDIFKPSKKTQNRVK